VWVELRALKARLGVFRHSLAASDPQAPFFQISCGDRAADVYQCTAFSPTVRVEDFASLTAHARSAKGGRILLVPHTMQLLMPQTCREL